MHIFREIYQYRELLKTNVKKDIRGRYKGSVLGILWSFLNPLLQVVVYWIVFPYLMRGTMENYLLYLITGIIPWNFFSTTVIGGINSIKSNAGIIKKVYFPREILLLSQVASGLVNFGISCVIILVFCVGTGAGISYYILAAPLIALIESLMILGIILILGSANVYVQDIEQIMSFVLNMLLYGTPIIYSLDLFAGSNPLLVQLINLNPMTTIINAYRDIFLYQQWPDFFRLGIVFVLDMALLILGYAIFKKLEKGFAENL